METAEGLETTFATNLAGHFLLTNLLIPRLVESGSSRIVNVTSGGMYSERIKPGDLQFQRREYSGTAAYAHAKRGQVILTGMWAQRLRGTGVTVHAMHPGWAKTAGVEQSLPTFNTIMKPFLRTPEQGADTMVWLAASQEAAETSGELWFDRSPVEKHFVDRTRESTEDRQAMWDALVEMTGSDMPDMSKPGR
jgi:NAD(P)-dependent dehydrogenase (short-subunit alcohol dehydrogenase family)